ESSSTDENDVEPAVPVVIDESAACPDNLGRPGLPKSTIHVPERTEARFLSHVSEGVRRGSRTLACARFAVSRARRTGLGAACENECEREERRDHEKMPASRTAGSSGHTGNMCDDVTHRAFAISSGRKPCMGTG